MEKKLQAECFQWHWNSLPEERKRLFHVNQKARNAIEGNKMRALGVVSGVSDLIYLGPGGKTVFIEMKTETGTQSPNQIDFENMVKGLGFEYAICRSLEEFKHIIKRLNL